MKLRPDDTPLIHCITNPISIKMSANAILALGRRPIMAEHPKEVKEITQTASAVCVNLGNITDVRIKSIKISMKAAEKHGIPVVVDAVGVACSRIRRRFALKLLEKYSAAIIKGNYSEILAMYDKTYASSGVDADKATDTESVKRASLELANKYNCVVLVSGETDIITDGRQVVYIQNGCPSLAKITGSGCALGTICACFLTEMGALDAATYAAAVLGICGEHSCGGNGSFEVRLMDKLSEITEEKIEKNIKKEVEYIEKN